MNKSNKSKKSTENLAWISYGLVFTLQQPKDRACIVCSRMILKTEGADAWCEACEKGYHYRYGIDTARAVLQAFASQKAKLIDGLMAKEARHRFSRWRFW